MFTQLTLACALSLGAPALKEKEPLGTGPGYLGITFTKDSDGLDAWEAEVRKAFLAAYAEAIKGSGLFASFDDVKGLLTLFELEKVLYELRYEINNRPAWIHVPLSGLTAMLGGSR